MRFQFALRRVVLTLLMGLCWGIGPVLAQPEVPELTGRVVDNANLLSPNTEQLITQQLAAHEDSTSNQVAVLTIESLEGRPIEQYSLEVARSWALGQGEFDNGVLLLIAKNDRKMRIEVGFGLEGDLPDVTASRIIRYELRPAFRQGDFDSGVRAGVSAILGAIEGTYEPPSGSSSSDEMPFVMRILMGGLFLFIPGFFAFFGIVSSGCVRWFLFVFLLPFFLAAGVILSNSFLGGLVTIGLYAVAFWWATRHPKVQEWSEQLKEAAKTGDKVNIGPFTVAPGSSSSGGSSFGGGGFSSGGGFSGGGGSFGGGGASGGW